MPGLLLGLGLGGLLDGILLHQVLQWHHMGTDHGVHASFPMTTVASLEDNTLWDGLFHAATWLLVVVGLYLLWAALRNGTSARATALTGLLLTGWGIFNLVEGVVDHLVLGIHHVRDDLGGPLAWDLGFLAFGAARRGRTRVRPQRPPSFRRCQASLSSGLPSSSPLARRRR